MSDAPSSPGGAREIALFPLHTVLYPGGALPLRIFETRYVDMVRDCMRSEQPFGVVPIIEGSDTGAAPRFHATGTLARIESWDQGPDGLLHILARGTLPFAVLGHDVRGDGLVTGTVATRDEPHSAIAPEFAFLRELLGKLFDARPEVAPPQPWRLDDACWLAYRFAELLPLEVDARLAVLELEQPHAKLGVIARIIEAASDTPGDDATH